MAESGFRGKSLKLVAFDVAEGYAAINPLLLKKFDKDMIKELYENLNRALTATRTGKIELSDQLALRTRNMRLQRLHNAMIVLRNTPSEKVSPSK